MSTAGTTELTDGRAALIRQAFRLEYITLAWMTIEAAVAIGSGVAADSLTVTAFGIDSLIELVSAIVLVWRLTVELRHGQTFAENAERIASRIGGALLFALAAYVVASASWKLWMQHGADFSLPGLVVCVLAIPTMYFLSRRKLLLANALGSRALRVDAVEGITCGCSPSSSWGHLSHNSSSVPGGWTRWLPWALFGSWSAKVERRGKAKIAVTNTLNDAVLHGSKRRRCRVVGA